MTAINHYTRLSLRLLTFLFAVLGLLPFVVLIIIISKLLRWRQLNQWVVTFWSRLMCAIMGLEIKIYGDKPVSPVMLVANHVSWLDIPIIHSFILAGFVAKHEIKYWPVLGWLAMAGDSVFLNRGNSQSRKAVLTQLKKRLTQGRSVAIFPEGTVTDGSYLRPFHRQLIHAAVETRTPIVPVAIKFLNQEGQREARVGFIDDEPFLQHVFRILQLPHTTVEIYCGARLTNYDAGTRIMTSMARSYIEQQLEQDDYLSSVA
ncbi:lysophospholipid acyltransferase family protein [Marinicella gelatinilytica]|uniref:lysophospholipid acyltransferase family protein n=1 Tax=Marinicella gelatinilytica TaxID=2996017 RepID=UPI0022609403|nr:lysophospholipid acyltransferase family protein [Marinicella gelatinilytica]MCX7545328.1 lysophospholipid acyltransferase family protein [Marinicella gelatinilytica]